MSDLWWCKSQTSCHAYLPYIYPDQALHICVFLFVNSCIICFFLLVSCISCRIYIYFFLFYFYNYVMFNKPARVLVNHSQEYYVHYLLSILLLQLKATRLWELLCVLYAFSPGHCVFRSIRSYPCIESTCLSWYIVSNKILPYLTWKSIV